MENYTKNTRIYLGTSETKSLIEVWGQNIEKLRETHKNKHVLQNMCAQLKSEHKVCLNAVEMRTRLNNLTKRYRQEKRKIGPSSGSPSKWQFYNDVHKVLSEQTINKTLDSESSCAEVQADEPTTSANSRNERKRKRKRQDDRFFQLIKDEQEMMQKYVEKSLANEEKIIKLLEENNALLTALINK